MRVETECQGRLPRICVSISFLSELHSRELLDEYLSRALSVELEHGRLTPIDSSAYVLTLDYAIKMLNIHERSVTQSAVVYTLCSKKLSPSLFFPHNSSPSLPLPYSLLTSFPTSPPSLFLPTFFFPPSRSLLPPPLLTHTHRYHCGVPVIIEGETGVGKTALLEMLSKLWNHSMLLEWKRQRGHLLDFIREKLGAIAADVSENYQVYFNSFCSLFLPPLPLLSLSQSFLSYFFPSNLRCVWKQWRH